MSSQTTEVVDRLYEVLVEEIRSHRPDLLDEAFTVAEIYQNLVPYRTHRDRIGTEMNGDYEHALLRLLAGAGDYVKLESDTARRRFEEELESVHPDTGIYRNFAACEVRLNPERVPAAEAGEGVEGDGVPAAPGPSDAVDAQLGSPAQEEAGDEAPSSDRGEGTAGAPGPREKEVSAPEVGDGTGDAERKTTSDDAVCRWCRERLPLRNDLEFCPFCGSRVDLVPCPECGTELDEDWLFCVACGTQVRG